MTDGVVRALIAEIAGKGRKGKGRKGKGKGQEKEGKGKASQLTCVKESAAELGL